MSKLRLRQVNKKIGNPLETIKGRQYGWHRKKNVNSQKYHGSGSNYEIICVVTASSRALNDWILWKMIECQDNKGKRKSFTFSFDICLQFNGNNYAYFPFPWISAGKLCFPLNYITFHIFVVYANIIDELRHVYANV